jgi:hypothetical protein
MDFNNPNAYGGQFANSPQHAQFDPQARLQQPNSHGQYGQAASFAGMGGAMGNNVMQPGGPAYLQRGKPVTLRFPCLCPIALPHARSCLTRWSSRATAAAPALVAEPLLGCTLFPDDALARPPAIRPEPPDCLPCEHQWSAVCDAPATAVP